MDKTLKIILLFVLSLIVAFLIFWGSCTAISFIGSVKFIHAIHFVIIALAIIPIIYVIKELSDTKKTVGILALITSLILFFYSGGYCFLSILENFKEIYPLIVVLTILALILLYVAIKNLIKKD